MWPKWLRERGIISAHPVQHVRGQEAPAEPWEKDWTAPDATQEAELVCKDCNEGWMSDLESAAADILEPMMLGNAHALDVAEQGIVALWAAKMTMVWEAVHPYVRAVSDEDYEHVFRWRSPPAGWRVWIAAYGGSAWNTYYFKHPLRLTLAGVHHADPAPVRAEEVNAHLSTFGVRAFVFQTFGAFHLDIRRPAALHERRLARYLRSIWPAEGFVHWPPDATLDDATLDALTEGRLAE